MRFPQLPDFLVAADAGTVSCFPVPDVPKGTMQHLYFNQVLPLRLSKRGKLVFHTTAVEMGAGAVAFVGESGRGKSTLAASFATSGHRVLTDEGAGGGADWPGLRRAAQSSVDPPVVRQRVRADPARGSAGATGALHPEARFLADEDLAFCDGSRPLRRLYISRATAAPSRSGRSV
jgi:hypothetical protein